ncbi:MAG: Pr6Pr family membrane protein [Ilumatobacteraceae bacterium]
MTDTGAPTGPGAAAAGAGQVETSGRTRRATVVRRRLFGARGEGVVRAYYGFFAAVLVATLIAQCILTHREGRSLVNTFSYFTIQSNVLVLIASAVLAVRPNVSGPAWRVLRLGSLCGITVTGLVYATVLAPYVHLTGWAMVYNCIFHYVMPAASVVGFVLVGPRVRLWSRDLVFMAWPVLWLAYTMLRGAFLHPEFTGFSQAPSHYPYEFLDVDRVSLVEVVGSITFVTLLLVGIGMGYIALSRRLSVPEPTSSGPAQMLG